MADDKKPDDFAEIMRRMGQTKVFPIDLQPINPAAPVEHFSPAKMRKALAEETGLSEDDLRQLSPGFFGGDIKPSEDTRPSKELQEMREEEVTAEPSLAGMLEGVDLADPRVKEFFARMSEPQEPEKSKKE